jgi:hypothetical protein
VDMTTTKLCNPCFWMSDLNSSSLIQGGRPNHGLFDALRIRVGRISGGGGKRSLFVELVAQVCSAIRTAAVRGASAIGSAGWITPGHHDNGRLLSPSCTTFVPRSTGFHQRHASIVPSLHAVWRAFGFQVNRGARRGDDFAATFSNATDFNSPVLTSSLSADSRRSCETNRR